MRTVGSPAIFQSIIDQIISGISIFGLPVEIVADNGPPFTSFEFIDFCTTNNIVLTHSPPYHPESNGLAERWVQTAKKALRKELLVPSHLSIRHRLSNFLFANRNTPCTVTGLTPAQLVLKQNPRSLLTALKPSTVSNPHPYIPKSKSFEPGDKVIIKQKKDQKVCVTGKIFRQLGMYLYEVTVDGKIIVCSVNQLARSHLGNNCHAQFQGSTDHQSDNTFEIPALTPSVPRVISPIPNQNPLPNVPDPQLTPPPSPPLVRRQIVNPVRRSVRVNKGCPPKRYGHD